jgi:tetratricopeptide (TPR) repeat protein
MKRLVVAALLVAACRGDKGNRKDAGPHGSASVVSVVPKLPRTEDGVAELRALDKRIELHATDLAEVLPLRMGRATLRGELEDYVQVLRESATLVERMPEDATAWQLRVQALLRVHDFAGARAALAKLAKLVHPSRLTEHEIAIADATGDVDRALAGRQQLANDFPDAQRLTLWATTLAQVGRFDEALALVPKAAAAVRDNPPQLIAWLLFQWGRCYELKGELATARDFFAASLARVPGYVEARAHLAQTMTAAARARSLTQDWQRSRRSHIPSCSRSLSSSAIASFPMLRALSGSAT